jgi:hypothetical protein
MTLLEDLIDVGRHDDAVDVVASCLLLQFDDPWELVKCLFEENLCL